MKLILSYSALVLSAFSENVLMSENTGFLSSIKDYGCWCKFGKDTLRGHGAPVDYIDKLCKDLTMCLKCPALNGVNSTAEDCIEATFVPVNTLSLDFTNKIGLENQCQELNTNPCGYHNCMCYSKFSGGILEIPQQSSKTIKLAATKDKYKKHFDNCVDDGMDSTCPEPEQEEENCEMFEISETTNMKKILAPGNCFKPFKFEAGKKKPVTLSSTAGKNPIKYFDEELEEPMSDMFCENNLFHDSNNNTISANKDDGLCITADLASSEESGKTFFKPCNGKNAQKIKYNSKEKVFTLNNDPKFTCLGINKTGNIRTMVAFIGDDKTATFDKCRGDFVLEKFEMKARVIDNVDSNMSTEEMCKENCPGDDDCYRKCVKEYYMDNQNYCNFMCGGNKCCMKQCKEIKPIHSDKPTLADIDPTLSDEDVEKDCMLTCMSAWKEPIAFEQPNQKRVRRVANIEVLSDMAKLEILENCINVCEGGESTIGDGNVSP